jgi:catechol 2,3-dioxygenase-like lactoylglutathione lyase family enzyme
MPIRELFHFMHLVDDFDTTHQRYAQLLAPADWGPKGWSDFDKRWANLANVGPNFVLEIMEPSKELDDIGFPLPKFFARHGPHLHSFAWYVDEADMRPLMERVKGVGARVLAPYIDADPDRPLQTFFTHPKDTFGQLEFQVRPTGPADRDRHLDPDWTGASFWRHEHPLGIERASHLTIVVSDVDRARSFYADGLGAPAFHEEDADDRTSAFCQVGSESVVELAQPKSGDSRIGRDLARHGDIPHAMTFKVADLGVVEKHVAGLGIGVAERSDETLVLSPEDMSNAVVAFTTRVLPTDPRS